MLYSLQIFLGDERVHILVINLMQIGDLVLTTPIFHAIKSAFPNYFLAAAVNRHFSELVKFNPFIDKLFEIDKASLLSTCHTIKAIRNHHFDLTVSLNDSERALAVALLSNSSRLVGYAKPPFSLFFDTTVPNLKRSTHQILSHFNVLKQAGLNLNLAPVEVFIPNHIQNHINAFWANHFNTADKVVAFNVGASWPSKRWLPDYFHSLALSLINQGFHVAFLGSVADWPIVNLASNNILSDHLHIFTGQFSLLQLAAFFDHCHLLISNDSGPMHIAAARNLPALSIFGSSPVTGFSPWLHSHTLIKSPTLCHS